MLKGGSNSRYLLHPYVIVLANYEVAGVVQYDYLPVFHTKMGCQTQWLATCRFRNDMRALSSNKYAQTVGTFI